MNEWSEESGGEREKCGLCTKGREKEDEKEKESVWPRIETERVSSETPGHRVYTGCALVMMSV